MEYPNLDKEQEIKEIKKIKENEYPRMWLEDISEWYPYPGTDPFPKEWAVKDIVVVSDVGTVRKGEERKTYRITNNTKKKQESGGFLLNLPDNIIKNLDGYDCNMRKSARKRGGQRKGTVIDGYRGTPQRILGSGDKYPDEYLGEDWPIAEIIWDHEYDDEKDEYYSADSVIIDDPAYSEWRVSGLHLSKVSFRMWEEGQAVRISKSDSKPIIYHMENLAIPNSAVNVSFMGSAKSKFDR
ncbi:MAG: hypothetical protein NTZ95_06625 [Candidatus Omnitrophica bacterium]|nr:hypothetical protein [Candidatus Omnitrophota bacterium]